MDHGPHSHVCADADGGVCHCDCRGRRHGVRHVPGGRVEHDPEVDVQISRIHKPGGGYRVVDRKTGLPPGGGTAEERQQHNVEVPDATQRETREQRLARRAREVTVRTQDDLDGTPALSNGLKSRIEAARASLPAGRKAWNDPIDNNKITAEAYRKDLARARERLEQTKAEREQAFADFERAYEGFSPKLKKRYREELEQKWQGYLESSEESVSRTAASLHSYENPQYESLTYPKSANGQTTVPAEWKAHLKTVMSVGREVLGEHRAGLARDPEHRRLKADAERLEAEAAALRAIVFDVVVPADMTYRDYSARKREALPRYSDTKKAAAAARAAAAVHDQQRLVAMLKSHRDFGGAHHDVEYLGADEQQAGIAAGTVGDVYGQARADAAEMMRQAEGFYPTEWIKRSKARSSLRVGTSDRAFYQDYGDGKPSFLAMPKGGYEDYAGGHGLGSEAGSLDVSVHELGHRMERAVPGLTQLEMTLVHDRSTSHDGVLEEAKQIAGYKDREMSHHDTWADPYAGKTYRGVVDPGGQAWELFQVGVQDTYGRQNRFDKSDDLQQFVIGALLTL